MRDRLRTVVRPWVTEKSSALYGAKREYTFVCNLSANKYQIKDAIESLFDVRVTRVRTLIQRSKRKTQGRTAGRTPRWKKAFVMLHAVDPIALFEG